MNQKSEGVKIKIIEKEGKKYVLDVIRKKYLVLTPEEWVRQNILAHLIEKKNYPPNLIRVEQKLEGKDLFFRADIVVYNKTGKALMIIECKAESVKITQDVFEQISKYNIYFEVDYLLVTNRLQTYICKIDYQAKTFEFLKEIPEYKVISEK